ncbi:hypothetical protein RUM4293_03003 [Ruegeria atlantica]|uniref:Uncharacterized protein n=1 Tax=Ruegeria atlantica TaxID=81569 RepID=A0A0P1E5Y8_9RHOB|nr:hypothetical protein RUM4293_03003 [Ruegeria atlantica]
MLKSAAVGCHSLTHVVELDPPSEFRPTRSGANSAKKPEVDIRICSFAQPAHRAVWQVWVCVQADLP